MTQVPVVSPGTLAVDSEAHRVYAAHAGTGTITSVDGTTGAEVTRLAGIAGGAALTVDPTTHRVYVANQRDGVVYVVDGDVTPLIVLAAVLVCGGIVARRAAARHRPHRAKETP